VNVDVTRSKSEGLPALADDPDVRLLFHRLNNQLGIILAHAELLEVRAIDDVNRARAGQVVTSVLDAMGIAREIRRHAEVVETGQLEA
jgi:hypothetical protein